MRRAARAFSAWSRVSVAAHVVARRRHRVAPRGFAGPPADTDARSDDDFSRAAAAKDRATAASPTIGGRPMQDGHAAGGTAEARGGAAAGRESAGDDCRHAPPRRRPRRDAKHQTSNRRLTRRAAGRRPKATRSARQLHRGNRCPRSGLRAVDWRRAGLRIDARTWATSAAPTTSSTMVERIRPHVESASGRRRRLHS